MRGVRSYMTASEKDDLFYVCTMIEYTARRTNNKRGVVVKAMGKDGIKKQLHDACVNHCLSFEQVSDEMIENYNISEGDFDTITECKYSIPSVTAIGRLYSLLITDCADEGKEVEEVMNIFSSFISDEISDFKTGVYFENPSYLKCSYQEGRLLD
jgi:hypothetical protein